MCLQGERQRTQQRGQEKKAAAPQIKAERKHLTHFLSELLLRKGPQSYAAIGATLYQNTERERVVDSYGGVRAFVLQHAGTFRRQEVEIPVEYKVRGELRTATTVCLEQSLVGLRPVLAEKMGAEDPPAIDTIAPCWSQGLAQRPAELPSPRLPA